MRRTFSSARGISKRERTVERATRSTDANSNAFCSSVAKEVSGGRPGIQPGVAIVTVLCTSSMAQKSASPFQYQENRRESFTNTAAHHAVLGGVRDEFEQDHHSY